ncbi:hypothetical protein AAHA92_28632 [Salvia divinorum]|uniref:Phorbol-ester/DAG-type domain-containing protein n=1 Tax=Salvia divinorum TaxID=28513 RepID=A0ABD1FVQ1_SALDI
MKKFHGHDHGLKLTTTEESGEKTCSVCELEISGAAAFSCTKRDCDFILHQSCSEIPKKLKHKSDPNHSFSLLSEPPEYSLYYSCDACGDLIRAFGFQCDECDHRMHVKCALLPESVECKAHKHALDLYYTTTKPNVDGCTFFYCDACDEAVTEGYWTYYCKECNFVTDLVCAFSAEAVKEKEEDKAEEEEDEEELPVELQLAKARIDMEQQRVRLEFQMQMARQNAQFMNSIANSWRSAF